MKLNYMLITGFLIIALLVGVVGSISIYQNEKIQDLVEKEIYRSISHLNGVWTLMEIQEYQEIASNNFLFLDDGLGERKADYFYEKKHLEDTYQKYYSESCEHVKPQLEKYYENMQLFNIKIEEAFELHEQGADLEIIKTKVKEANKYAEIAREDYLEIIIEHMQKDHIEPAKQDITKGISNTNKLIFVVSAIIILLAIGIGFFFSFSISKPIQELTRDVDEISKGNFDIQLKQTKINEVQSLTNSLNRILASMKLAISKTGASKADLGIGTKEALEAKNKAEEKYEILYQTSRDAIMTLAPPLWKFTAGNPATIKMFNCKNEKEFISFGPGDLSPEHQPDGQLSSEKAKKMIMKAMEQGSNFFEWTHKTIDGIEFPTTVLLTRIKLGKKDLLQATVRDISKEREVREKYKVLFENASEAIFIADTKTKKLIDCNKIAEKLTGYTKEEILNMNADQLHPKDKIKQTMGGFQKQAEGKIKSVESEVLTKDKKRIPVSISTAPVKIGDKNLMFGIFRVITGKQ